MRILVVDDEPSVRNAVRRALVLAGYAVTLAEDGEQALSMLAVQSPDAVVLDLLMPSVDGLEVCRRLRAAGDRTPVLMLTARDSVADRVRGLDAGADDYVTKPFSVNELIARMRAIFRRAARVGPAPEAFEIGGAQVNFAAHALVVRGESHALSFYEVELLRLLVERVGQPVSRDEILSKIWGLEAGPTNRTVDNFIVKLRKKLEDAPDKPKHILTVYGFGYKLAL